MAVQRAFSALRSISIGLKPASLLQHGIPADVRVGSNWEMLIASISGPQYPRKRPHFCNAASGGFVPIVALERFIHLRAAVGTIRPVRSGCRTCCRSQGRERSL